MKVNASHTYGRMVEITASMTKIGLQSMSKRFNIRLALGLAAIIIAASAVFVSSSAKNSADASVTTPESVGVIQNDGAGPITVTATAGTTGPINYPTLNDAFVAINAGTHQGAITVDVVANTTEVGVCVLNSSGAGSAVYTSVLIRPTVDTVTIAGPTVTGRGLIELNGADNVTIDGDNPNTAGTNRNLTIQNTAANTITFTSVIRIALATTIVTSADNCAIRNLNVLGSATGRNIAAATTTTGTENTTFGILATGGASTVSPTTAPAAITSVTTVIAAGATATNLAIQNNNIQTTARAVSVNGSATTVFPGLLIENNLIGNATAGAVDQVYSIGITGNGSADGIIRGNTVYIEGFIASSTATHAINVGVVSTNSTAFTIEKNKVSRVRNNNPQGWSAYGINLGGGNNHIVRNNFVFDVRNDQTAGTGAFGTTFGAYGIRVASGTGHKIYHNSVHLFGVLPGAVSTNLTVAFVIVATTQTGMDVRNNIFSNQLTGGNPLAANTRHAVIFLPSAATVAMNLTLNNNAYYQGPSITGALSLLAQVGTTAGGGQFFAADFNPGTTTPATNLRAYTSTLSAGGTNDNASFAVAAAPPFVSDTDLHIPAGTATRLESGGASGTGVTDDIDAEVRNVTTPDIGADEFAGVPPPANDIAASAIVVPTNGSLVSTGTTVTPQASFTNVGTAAQTNVMVQFMITGPGGYNYTDTQTIASITPNQTVTVTFTAAPVLTTAGTYNTTATILTADANAANNTLMGTFQVAAPLSGSFNVGAGETFTSLTNAGGVFDAINGLGASSNIVVNVTTDLTAETGTISLNQVAGGFTVTIQPNGGAARTISGSGATALINLNGADNVTINGVNAGGNALTIRNTGAGSTIRLIADASNNIIQNCTIEGAGTAVILLSTGTTTGNDNNSISGNTVRDRTAPAAVPANLISSIGTSAAIANSGTTVSNNTLTNFTVNGVNIGVGNENIAINGNDISQTANRTTAIIGINVSVAFGTGSSISQNNIHDLRTSVLGGTFISTAGIFVLDSRNMTISRNRVYSFPALAGGTGRIVGIEYEGADLMPSSAVIVNNMVSIITSVATAQSVFGIFDFAFGGNTVTIDHNSIYIGGTASGAANSWALQRGALAPTNYTARNNIAFNDRTGGTGNHFAGGDQSANGGTFVSNFNFFAGTGVTPANFMDYGTSGVGTPVSFSTWQAGPPARDANSIAGIASTFNANNFFVNRAIGDLHLLATATPVLDAGTPLASVTTDFDGQPRSATAPDIGADEFVVGGTGVLAFNSPTYTIGEAGGMATITVTRTGGSSGTVMVDYATVAGGTATGGAACGGTVDYVTTSGTLTFPDTNTSQSFDIPICSDLLDEPDETVNLALSNPQGGATIGTQNMAVLTITDDDAAPGIAITSPSPLPEGNVGTTPFTFNVNLSEASGQTVTVHYQTADGSATVANNDYVPISDTTLTFNPGQTTMPVTVNVNGDVAIEPTENFFVNLSMATNATIGTGQGTGTIQNDDAGGGTFSIDDVRTVEGNTGIHFVTFTVSYTTPGSPPPASVQYTAVNGTAMNGFDFGSASGTLFFGMSDGGGTTQTRTFTVAILSDTEKEPNETFFVELTNPNGGTISDGMGVCIIVDEDRAYAADFDRDLKSDLSVFRPGDANWYIRQSTNLVTKYQQFGANGDKIVPGDYDADGVTDLAHYRPSTGSWFIERSSDFGFVQYQFGLSNDIPVQGDYDGDDKTDVAVFRPSTATWYILRSSDNGVQVVQFGSTGDRPVPGDFDGDGVTDITVFRESTGTWHIEPNSEVQRSQSWGMVGDVPVSGDFDGDGRTDIAVFRPSNGTWYILTSLNGSTITQQWGSNGDIPVVGDYDADGTSDIAVWRPSNGNWYILNSNQPPPPPPPTDAVIPSFGHWGQAGDKPAPAAYVPEQ